MSSHSLSLAHTLLSPQGLLCRTLEFRSCLSWSLRLPIAEVLQLLEASVTYLSDSHLSSQPLA